MKLKNGTLRQLESRIGDRSIVCIGAGAVCTRFFCNEAFETLLSKVKYVIDNDNHKRNTVLPSCAGEIPVISMEDFTRLDIGDCIILITSAYWYEIVMQLEQIDCFRDKECYIYVCMMSCQESFDRNEYREKFPMIPKVIHYAWFGGKELSPKNRRCIESWKRYCPDYEIKRWDESNYDVTRQTYPREAYQCKKWAFLTDYARLDILYQYGGIFLDVDVEVIRNLDELLYNHGFIGFDSFDFVNAGSGIGAEPGFPMIKEMLEVYHTRKFLREDGSMDLTICNTLQTDVLRGKGLLLNNRLQMVEGMKIYPIGCFSPKNWYTNLLKITENTYSIHHFDASWVDGGVVSRMRNNWERITALTEMLQDLEITACQDNMI